MSPQDIGELYAIPPNRSGTCAVLSCAATAHDPFLSTFRFWPTDFSHHLSHQRTRADVPSIDRILLIAQHKFLGPSTNLHSAYLPTKLSSINTIPQTPSRSSLMICSRALCSISLCCVFVRVRVKWCCRVQHEHKNWLCFMRGHNTDAQHKLANKHLESDRSGR